MQRDLDILNSDKLESYSNAFGDKIKKALSDAGKSIKNAGHDLRTLSAKEIANNLKKEGKRVQGKIGDVAGGGKSVHLINIANPVFLTMRGALLFLLNNNVVGIGKAFSLIKDKADTDNSWNEILQKFWMWGGDKGLLNRAIDNGKNKKPLFLNVIDKITNKKYGFDGYSNANGENIGTIITKAAVLLGVLVPVSAINPATAPSAPFLTAGASAFGLLNPIISKFAKKNGATDKDIKDMPTEASNPIPVPLSKTEQEELDRLNSKSIGMSPTLKWTLIGGGILLLVGGIITTIVLVRKK